MKHIINFFKFLLFFVLSVLLFELLSYSVEIITKWVFNMKHWVLIGILIYSVVIIFLPMIGLFAGNYITRLNPYNGKGALVVSVLLSISFIVIFYEVMVVLTVWEYTKSVIVNIAWITIIFRLLICSIIAAYSKDEKEPSY